MTAKKEFTEEEKLAGVPFDLTQGQKLVGVTFNPSYSKEVSETKQTFADLIDKMLSKKTSTYNDNLVRGNAIQSLIQAQMAVVIVLTWDFKEDTTKEGS